MGWLKVETITPDKPEIGTVAEVLQLDPEIVFTKCFRLWAWADKLTKTGFVKGARAAQIDRMVGQFGFCNALQQVGWLSVTDLGISIPNFARHNGKSQKKREQTAERVRRYRALQRNGSNALRGEERREEENNPLVAPLTWSPASGWTNLDGHVAEWRKAYPDVDVRGELGRMESWLNANPSKAKKSNWKRFIVSWLSKNQREASALKPPATRISAVEASLALQAAREGES